MQLRIIAWDTGKDRTAVIRICLSGTVSKSKGKPRLQGPTLLPPSHLPLNKLGLLSLAACL